MNPSCPQRDDLTEAYLDTLLLYFEEEIMGEAYFYGLAERFPELLQKEKLSLLAQVERYAAEAVRPLLERHGLVARPDSILHEIGRSQVEKSASMGWNGFVDYMVVRFPGYMPEFYALEAMAPEKDLKELKKLTQHEVAAIDFARMEQAGDPHSTRPLLDYLGKD